MEQRVVIGVDYDSHAVHFAILGERVKVSRYHLSGEDLISSIDGLATIFRGFLTISYHDAFVIIEAPVYIQNPRTSFKLAQVQTLIRVACETVGLKYEVLESTRWKKLALGSARKNKQEVLEAMRFRFGDVISDSHFADATAMALAGMKLLKEVE